jgi:hypothetical protein
MKWGFVLSIAAALSASAASGQILGVYSEFARIDTQGNAVAPETPREILSPALLRNNGVLPTSIDGVSVSVAGQPAYVYYVSATQINAIALAVRYSASHGDHTDGNDGTCYSDGSPLSASILPVGSLFRGNEAGFQSRGEAMIIPSDDHTGQTRRRHHPLGNRLRPDHTRCSRRV